MPLKKSGKFAAKQVDLSGKSTDYRGMNPIPHLLTLARLYGEAVNAPPSTVSWRAFGDSKRIRALEDGKTITIRRAEAVIGWFAEHWPPGVDWPAGLDRPEKSRSAA